MKAVIIIFCLLFATLSGGCSSNETSSNFAGGRSTSANAELTLSVTDAAVDSAAEVWVAFTSIEIKPADSTVISHTFDSPVSINLLSLQGSLSEDFFNNLEVPSGTYNWVRLSIKSVSGERDTYIVFKNGSEYELSVPSGSESGLKIISNFDLDANSATAMTIDFDLRRSIVAANNDRYMLKPALRLIENTQSVTLQGSIDTTLTLGADCSDADTNSGNAIYLFNDFNAALDDVSMSSGPFTTALIDSSTGDYEVGFLPPGDYTVAFTCMADLDDPEANDVIIFQSVSNISLSLPANTGAVSNR